MKLRVLVITSSLFAAAALFSFCTKETPSPDTLPVATNADVSSRTPCDITIQANGPINVCGSQTDLTVCSVVGGVPLLGSTFIPTGVAQSLTLNAPANLQIRLVTPSLITSPFVFAKITTSTGSYSISLPLDGTPVPVHLNGDCSI